VNRTPDLIAALDSTIEQLSFVELPAIRGELARLDAKVMARITSSAQLTTLPAEGAAVPDEEIDVVEAAKVLGMSESYMYKHAKEYGGAKHGSALRFSRRQLEAKRKRRHYN